MAKNRFPRVVFVRVGWMKYYGARLLFAERPIGGGAFNDDAIGWEADNFARQRDDLLLGWFQPPGGARGFNLRRIDPRTSRTETELADVLVVLVATDPNGGGQRIVGWYGGARCRAEFVDAPRGYVFSAPVGTCVLLPEHIRRDSATPKIPKGKGGFGQANVCYSTGANGAPSTASWMGDAVRFVLKYAGPNVLAEDPAASEPVAREVESFVRGSVAAPMPDAAKRRAVELHAMAVATRLLEPEWTVENVSARSSYDLHCRGRADARELRVEVKGTTGSGDAVLVTENEVRHARQYRPDVEMVIVSGIIVDRDGRDEWRARGGTVHRFRWDPDLCDLEPIAFRCRVRP